MFATIADASTTVGQDIDVSMTGFAAVDETAAYHAVGEAAVSFGGIDGFLGRLAGVPHLEEVVVGLNVLRIFAHPDTQTGRHRLTFEVTADGRTLVNGADIGLMFRERP